MAGRISYYGNIAFEGLILNFDAAKKESYNGGTSWNDIMENGCVATLTNGAKFDNENIGTISFDGLDDFALITPAPDISSNLTYCAWVNVNSFAANNAVLSIEGTLLQLDSSGITWWSNIILPPLYEGISKNTGEWYYISVTHQGTQSNIFVNGLKTNGPSTMPTINTSYPGGENSFRMIGCYGGNIPEYPESRHLNGRVNNVLIYNRALSESEVLQNYNATKSRFGL